MALTAAQLMVKVSAEGVEAVRSSLSGLGGNVSEVGQGFGGALKQMLEFAGGQFIFQEISNAVGELKSQVEDFLKSGFDFNSNMEMLHQQLKAITQSGSSADQILDWTKKFGQTVPDTTEHLASAVVQIQSLGLNAEDTIPSIANVAAVMGRDLPTAAQAFSDAYEGRFQMMQMNLHITKKQLEDFGLDVNDIQGTLPKAFEALQKAKFPTGLTDAMGTWQGQVSNLTDRYQMLAGSIMQPVFKGAEGELKNFFDFMDSHKSQVDAIGTAVGQGLGGAFRFLVSAVGGAARFFSSDVLPVLRQFGGFLDQNQGSILAVGAGMEKNLLPAVQTFGAFAKSDLLPLVEAVGLFFATKVLPVLVQVAGFVVTNVVPILGTLAQVFQKNILPAIDQVWTTISNQLLPPLEHMISKILPVLNPLLNTLGWLMQNIVGPALSLVVSIFAGLATGLDWVVTKISDLIGWLDKLLSKFGGLGTLLKDSNPLYQLVNVVQGKGLQLPHFAAGGTTPGGPVLVGENGPEVLIPPAGSQVIPNYALAGGAGAGYGSYGAGASALGGAPQTIILQVDGRRMAEVTVKHLPSVVRNGLGSRGF